MEMTLAGYEYLLQSWRAVGGFATLLRGGKANVNDFKY
jgi:hypothetical protein